MKVRWLGVKGRLSSGISDADVTITSDGLADLPEIVAPDYAIIVLDPDGVSGRPEAVRVTAHAASATSATVEREVEQSYGGSPARAHAANMNWYHAAIPKDFHGLVSAADEAERESYIVDDGTTVWQEDTSERWTYMDGATPYWTKNNTYHQFVYNSSGTQGGNRYNNWNDLITFSQTEEGPKIFLFEQDETIPAGAWNLDNIELRGNGLEYNAGGVTLTFGDGTTISSWANPKINSIRLLSTSTTGPVWSPSGAAKFNISQVSNVHSTTNPFIEHSGGGQFIIALQLSSRWKLLSGGVENFHDTSAAFATTLIMSRGAGSEVNIDTLSSDNDVIFIDVIADAGNDLANWVWPGTHTNLSIGFQLGIMQPRSIAVAVDVAGLTVVTATNVQEAIEELDAAVGAVPTLASGTYTPTLTNVSNVSSSLSSTARWTRIGDQIHVSGRCSIDPSTTATLTEWGVSLPVASNFAANSEASGVAVGDLSDESPAHGYADYTNDRMHFIAYPVSTSQHTYSYEFTYTVI